jgi:hypothetical protein
MQGIQASMRVILLLVFVFVFVILVSRMSWLTPRPTTDWEMMDRKVVPPPLRMWKKTKGWELDGQRWWCDNRDCDSCEAKSCTLPFQRSSTGAATSSAELVVRVADEDEDVDEGIKNCVFI